MRFKKQTQNCASASSSSGPPTKRSAVNPPESSRNGSAPQRCGLRPRTSFGRVASQNGAQGRRHSELTVHGVLDAGLAPRKASTPSTNWRDSSTHRKMERFSSRRNHQRRYRRRWLRSNVIPNTPEPFSIYALFAFPICAAWNESFTLFVLFTRRPA